MDNNAGDAVATGTHGINFQFPKRELKGEYSPSEKEMKEMGDKMKAH